jgi:hypothetical protein
VEDIHANGSWIYFQAKLLFAFFSSDLTMEKSSGLSSGSSSRVPVVPQNVNIPWR